MNENKRQGCWGNERQKNVDSGLPLIMYMGKPEGFDGTELPTQHVPSLYFPFYFDIGSLFW